jgi:hypothetical protein
MIFTAKKAEKAKESGIVRLRRKDLPVGAVRTEGTCLWLIGKAERLSAKNRHAMGIFWCDRCGSLKKIRIVDVRPHTTITCGCFGRKQFIERYEQHADNLSSGVRNRIWGLKYGEQHWTRRNQARLDNAGIARLLKLEKYIVDFAIAAKCRVLRAIAKSGKSLLDVVLSTSQWVWLRNFKFKGIRMDCSVNPEVEASRALLERAMKDESIAFSIS